MLSIQEIGKEILTDNPKKFYFLCGPEFGIKTKYIEHLTDYYNNNVAECPTVESVLKLFEKKTLFPTPNSLYIVRYDETFISKLSEYKDITSFDRIRGTMVAIYVNEAHANKLDKVFPYNTASIDNVATQYVVKYLTSDFPNLSKDKIKIVSEIASDYNQAKLMCFDLSMLPETKLNTLNKSSISKLFGLSSKSTETAIRLNVAGRSFSNLVKLIENYSEDLQTIYYTILQTMIELDKIYDSKYANSDIKEYKPLWSREDIYYMFNHTYNKLIESRSGSTDVKESLVFLFGLLNYQRIPSVTAMK